ncbi:hemicentin-2 [Caerostris extrusa]|uniref:Hemicentin-2 n=1 Tax=Caerostris extrusa TaxID=172846 RepID=A0AAV4UAW2_CAEEX|nr:hemicentin-2 [Caerostris extrusa]
MSTCKPTIDGLDDSMDSSKSFFILVPPKKLIIRDDSGQEVREIAGPYKERSTVSLSCEAQKGIPAPNVTWWRDNKPWDSTFQKYSTGVLNDMKLINLSRSDLFATFHCKAQNTKLTSPVVRTIVLDMYLYPLTSRITSRLSTLAAGRRLDLACETQGSRPTAKISWWLDGSPSPTTSTPSTTTSPPLSCACCPSPSTTGRPSLCRAQNPKLYDSALEDVRVLNVTFSELTIALFKVRFI